MTKFENTEILGWEHAIRGCRNPMNSWDKSDSKSNIITLCGSSKFKNEFLKVQKELSLKGYLVLSLGLFGHSGDDEAWVKKDLLDRVHKQKIGMSSAIFVIDVDGYVGESTKNEIEYAINRGKTVYFYSHDDLEAVQEISNSSLIGPNDLNLMRRLAAGGPVHAKYRRMIAVYVDITAPLYWWKEFDTYKVGTVANSCSTMHKIADKEFTLEDFSCEHLIDDNTLFIHNKGDFRCISNMQFLMWTIDFLNENRRLYLEISDELKKTQESYIVAAPDAEEKALKIRELQKTKKTYWWQMIQLLPSSYNQKRTVMMNYEVLANIYKSRRNHRLDEWSVEFIEFIKSLPYSELITYEDNKNVG